MPRQSAPLQAFLLSVWEYTVVQVPDGGGAHAIVPEGADPVEVARAAVGTVLGIDPVEVAITITPVRPALSGSDAPDATALTRPA